MRILFGGIFGHLGSRGEKERKTELTSLTSLRGANTGDWSFPELEEGLELKAMSWEGGVDCQRLRWGL